jgi:DNA-binding transcriptional LysR family regulator
MLVPSVRYLKAVADHGSFTRAAAALHVSQPALSQQIRELDERMGVQLLDRSGRTVRPTDVGEAYLRHVRRALDELEVGGRAIRDVQDLSSGALRLGFTPSFAIYLLGPLIRRYRDRFPGVVLTITGMAQKEMELALDADALDVGLAFSDVLTEHAQWLPLYTERLSLIVGQGHPAANCDREIDAAALVAEPLVRWGPPSRHAGWWTAICAATAFTPMWRWKPIRSQLSSRSFVPPDWRRSCRRRWRRAEGSLRRTPDARDRFLPRGAAPAARRLSQRRFPRLCRGGAGLFESNSGLKPKAGSPLKRR